MSLHIAANSCGRKTLGKNATDFMFHTLRNSIFSVKNTGNRLQREIQHAKASSYSNGKTLRNTFVSKKAQIEEKSKTNKKKTFTSKKKDTSTDHKELIRKAELESVEKGVEDSTTNDLFQPVQVSARRDTGGLDIGAELTGSKINRNDMLELLRKFYNQPKTQILATEHGLDENQLRKSFDQFRRYCVETDPLPVGLHILFSDILAGAGHVDDIFPYFLQYAKQVYPHLECMEDLRKISDLTEPAHWYPVARNLKRKIIYHAGPTNSGKTYHALKRFVEAKSGVYCGPLRMLAAEVFKKCNETETPCDLVTGEDRRQANPDCPAEHVACTVEMANISKHYEVAIIDEIQMLRDQARGWAWTRALHGICADEVHLCGEGSALDIVQAMAELCGDTFEMRGYKRMTKLTILDQALVCLDNVQPGDCIVCFSRKDIYYLSGELENLGHQCAVIYGGLPPGTKYSQAEKFNDPNDPCNVLVATDAIGMGLNLAIKRIIFYTVHAMVNNKDGTYEKERMPTSQILQIAGRAGRYGTRYELGEVTTFNKVDLPVLNEILAGSVAPIEKVGLQPTADQIEMFAYHLPKASLSELIDIFMHLCKVDDHNYFMCNMKDFKFLADLIKQVPLPLNVRYVFCCAPISAQESRICAMFQRFGRQYSTGRPLTYEFLMDLLNAPFKSPKTLPELMILEQNFDVFDLYLWLGYRFPDMFPDMEFVREAQSELDNVIQESVDDITALLEGRTNTVRKAATTASKKEHEKKSEFDSNLASPDHLTSAYVSLKGDSEKLDERTTDNLNFATFDSAEPVEYISEEKENVQRANVKREKSKSDLKIHSKFERDTQKREKHIPTWTFKNDSAREADIPKRTRLAKQFALSESHKKAVGDTDKKEQKAVPYRRGKLTQALLESKILTEEMLLQLHNEHESSRTADADVTINTKKALKLPEHDETDSERDKID